MFDVVLSAYGVQQYLSNNMNPIQQRAAREFAAKWKGKGYEKGESQSFGYRFSPKCLALSTPTSG
ncbi:MAG: hypothetical protein IJ834_08940 [Paludibacteraceae bacterium]|nr:hypothetical protein [Paludibacteraceae bacterium]